MESTFYSISCNESESMYCSKRMISEVTWNPNQITQITLGNDTKVTLPDVARQHAISSYGVYAIPKYRFTNHIIFDTFTFYDPIKTLRKCVCAESWRR